MPSTAHLDRLHHECHDVWVLLQLLLCCCPLSTTNSACPNRPQCAAPNLDLTSYLDGLHHKGNNVWVLLQLLLQRAHIVVRDDLKSRHKGAKALQCSGNKSVKVSE